MCSEPERRSRILMFNNNCHLETFKWHQSLTVLRIGNLISWYDAPLQVDPWFVFRPLLCQFTLNQAEINFSNLGVWKMQLKPIHFKGNLTLQKMLQLVLQGFWRNGRFRAQVYENLNIGIFLFTDVTLTAKESFLSLRSVSALIFSMSLRSGFKKDWDVDRKIAFCFITILKT